MQRGRFALRTKAYLHRPINPKTRLSSADIRTLRTKAIHSAAITGRKNPRITPSRTKIYSIFCTAVKNTEPIKIISSIFFIFFELSSIYFSDFTVFYIIISFFTRRVKRKKAAAVKRPPQYRKSGKKTVFCFDPAQNSEYGLCSDKQK